MTDGLGMHYVTSLLIDMQKIINIWKIMIKMRGK